MEPIKQLSVLLQSSMEAMIHDTLDYFLRLLYGKLERASKRRVGSCTLFNTFVNMFRQKLMTLLDNVKQFFLWVVAATLDGGRPILTGWLLFGITGTNGRILTTNTEMYANGSLR